MNISRYINLDNNDKNIHSISLKDNNCNQFILDTLIDISNNPQNTYIYSDNIEFCAYFSVIIQAIAGANYEEIVNDYMENYRIIYGISKEDTPDEYNAIKTYHIDNFLQKLSKTPDNYDFNKCDFAFDAEMYLRSHGATNDQIIAIKNRLCK